MGLLLSVALLTGGLLVPAHWRGLDAVVAQSAGRNDASVPEVGQMLAGDKKLGAAHMLLAAAQAEKEPRQETLAADLTSLIRQYPQALFWGDDTRAETLFGNNFHPADQNSALASFIIRQENRETALTALRRSPKPRREGAAAKPFAG